MEEPENRWYNDDINVGHLGPIDGDTDIKIIREEYVEWCQPWKRVLVVSLLGKRVNAKFLEERLRRH